MPSTDAGLSCSCLVTQVDHLAEDPGQVPAGPGHVPRVEVRAGGEQEVKDLGGD